MGIGTRRTGSTSRSSGSFRSSGSARPVMRRSSNTTSTQRTSYTRSNPTRTAQATTKTPSAPRQGVTRTVSNPTAPAQAPTTTANAANTPRTRNTAPAAPAENAAPQTSSWQDKIGQGWGLLKEGVKEGVQEKFGANPTPEERASMEYVRNMLEPNKLGGEDRTFNYGDRQAIINSLMRDRQGLKQEVVSQLRAEGKDFQANVAARALDGKRGLLTGPALKKIYREAPGQINQQLNQGLREAHIDPNTAQQVDNQPRNVNFAEMKEFQRNAEVLQAMQQRVAEKLGMDVTFPNGISQEAIDFTLQGKFGLPPGAVLTPRK